MSPKQFCDEVSERFRRLTTAMESSNDFFIRTTDPEHERRVQDFVQHLYDDGHLYEGTYAGLYCSSCEVFYAEGDLIQPGNLSRSTTAPSTGWRRRTGSFRSRSGRRGCWSSTTPTPTSCAPAPATTRPDR